MPKRLKIIITILISTLPTFVHFGVFSKFQPAAMNGLFISSFGFSVFSCLLLYIGIYWILEKPMKLIGYATYMLFPSLFAFPFLYLFNHIFIRFEFMPLFILGLCMVFIIYLVCLYAIALSVNILNVSSVSKIPLAQAANTIVFVFTFLSGYLYYSIVLSQGFPWIVTVVPIFLVSCLLLFQAFTNIVQDIRQGIKLSLIGGFAILEVYLFLLPWKVSFLMLSLIFTVLLYVYHSIMLHEDRNTFTWAVIMEYVILSIITLGIVFITSSQWGISGTLF